MSLGDQLAALAPALRQRLDARGFDAARLQRWADAIDAGQEKRNWLVGEVAAVPDEAIENLPASDSLERRDLERLGSEALARGQLAVCVLAGGMATRMGGVVKALVEVSPGKTFLDLRLDELKRVAATHGADAPLWLMTSEPTHAPIAAALREREATTAACFEQFVSLRLAPNGELFMVDGEPSVYATGHGDLPDALRATPLLDTFRERGGRYVWISNLDNVGATVDATVLGSHIASGAAMTVELADKHPGDAGGGPVLHDGAPIIAESFRVPDSFDLASVPVFNTNTFLVDADALARLQMDWTYVMVRKQVDDRDAIQFERLLGEMTMAIAPRFLRVPRDGGASRFLPIKSYDDLEQLRDTIRAVTART